MTKSVKRYDLEERTFRFAERVRDYVTMLPKTIANVENGKQLVRAAGSVGANYIEANESLSKKDFLMRIKISRKESKESCYWLKLSTSNPEHGAEKESLARESVEFVKIFNAILQKSK